MTQKSNIYWILKKEKKKRKKNTEHTRPSDRRTRCGHRFYQVRFTKLGMAVPATLTSMAEPYNSCNDSGLWYLRSLLAKSSVFRCTSSALYTARNWGVGYKLQGLPKTDVRHHILIWWSICYGNLEGRLGFLATDDHGRRTKSLRQFVV